MLASWQCRRHSHCGDDAAVPIFSHTPAIPLLDLQAQEIFIQESFARQPFAEGIILKTKRGARFQPAARKWKAADDTGSQPYLRITETHGDSVLTLPADSQVRHCADSAKTLTRRSAC